MAGLMDFEGRNALITGSATGLGAETAVQLAGGGARVVLNYSKSAAECESTADRCRAAGAPDVKIVQANVADDADCRALATASAGWGALHILVNNAGITKHAHRHADMDALSADDFHRLYAVNTIGPFQMIRACKPQLVQAFDETGLAASVVMISSIAGIEGIGSSVAYAASKGALNTMTRSLGRALGPAIRVNAICPGFIDTRWFPDAFGEETTARIRETVSQKVPLQVASSPQDIAASVTFFCSSASRHITGETLLVDAGHHLSLN